MKWIIALLIALTVACGTDRENHRSGGTEPAPAPQPGGQTTWIVQTRATVNLTVHTVLGLTTWTSTGSDNTDVVNATMSPTATSTMSTASFSVPTMTSDLLSFGSLNLTALRDNNLKVCGTGAQKCTAAALRIYTTGQAGAGFYNSADGYGAPLNVAVGTGSYATAGLGSANANYVEQITIAGNKNVINLSDFTYPNILVQGDFTNAGAGSYSTTINVEFVVGL